MRCVGAIIVDAAGRLLVIQRGQPPGEGLWSLPGGRVEPGESDTEAVRREVKEETGLDVEPGPETGTVQRPGPNNTIYDIHDYTATAQPGIPTAGDDARAVRWVTQAELRDLPTTEGLIEALTAWRVL